ncbi:MAG TPA: VanZ family protein [Blastocatellia bacterium]
MIENAGEARPLSITGGLLKYWAPPIIWMSAIFFFSTDLFSGGNTGSLLWKVVAFIYPGVTRELFGTIHFFIRKAAHFTVYAVLALLLFRAFRSGAGARWRWSWALFSLLIAFSYATLDEYHQTFTRHREGSIYDSLIDTSGALVALVLLWFLSHRGAEMKSQRIEDRR